MFRQRCPERCFLVFSSRQGGGNPSLSTPPSCSEQRRLAVRHTTGVSFLVTCRWVRRWYISHLLRFDSDHVAHTRRHSVSHCQVLISGAFPVCEYRGGNTLRSGTSRFPVLSLDMFTRCVETFTVDDEHHGERCKQHGDCAKSCCQVPQSVP